jgi:hypothetical protein
MKATTLITGGLIGTATLLASVALAEQAHSDPPGWTYMDYDAVARDAKAAGITVDPVSVEVVMVDVCYWLHNDEPTPRWPGRSHQSSDRSPRRRPTPWRPWPSGTCAHRKGASWTVT